MVKMRSFSGQRRHAVNELRRTLRSWEYESGQSLERLLVSGSGASDAAVLASVHEAIASHVVSDPIHPFAGVSCAEAFDNDHCYVIAYGLARRAAGLERTGLNFLSEQCTGVAPRFNLGSVRTTALCLGALAVSGMIYLNGVRYRMEGEYDIVRKESARLFQEVMPQGTAIIDAPAQIEQYLAGRERVSDYIRRFAGNDDSAIDLLRTFSVALPGDLKVVVDRLEFEEGAIQCRGKADTFRDLDKLKDALVRSGRFSRIVMTDMKTSRDRKSVTFDMKVMPA